LVLLGVPDQRQMRTEGARVGVDGAAAARIITEGYRPGDGFVPVRGADRVYMTDFQVEYFLPGRVQLRDVFAQRSALAADDLFPVECPEPEQCLGTTRRIWVVTWGGTQDPFHKLPEDQADALRAHYRVADSQKVRGLRVSLLERTR
jgi:mannosyltransferase